MILLVYFDRAYKAKIKNPTGGFEEKYRHEIVRCHLWFSDQKDLELFLDKHAPIKFNKSIFDTDKEFYEALKAKTLETKWEPFYTMTKEQLGFSK